MQKYKDTETCISQPKQYSIRTFVHPSAKMYWMPIASYSSEEDARSVGTEVQSMKGSMIFLDSDN